MALDPHRPALCVLQATIAAGSTADVVTRAMPAAPFGTPAWQLPLLAGYLAQLRRTAQPPHTDSFTAYLDSRTGGAVPAPHRPYNSPPLHDPRVTCLIDVVLAPHGHMGWPAVTLVVLEQEADLGGCSWSRIERHRGFVDVLTHTAREITAEQARLSDRVRTAPDPGLQQLKDLAGRVGSWAVQLHRAARGDHTQAQAAAVRTRIARPAAPNRFSQENATSSA